MTPYTRFQIGWNKVRLCCHLLSTSESVSVGVSGLGDVASCSQKKRWVVSGVGTISRRMSSGSGGCQADVAADHLLHGVYDHLHFDLGEDSSITDGDGAGGA